MKYLINIFLLISFLILLSCDNGVVGNIPENSNMIFTKIDGRNMLPNIMENISIKDIPQEKVNAVLRDYLAKTVGSTYQTMADPNYIVKVVDTISEKNNLSMIPLAVSSSGGSVPLNCLYICVTASSSELEGSFCNVLYIIE